MVGARFAFVALTTASLATACIGTESARPPEPRSVDAYLEFPSLVVSPEHPVATVFFSVATTGPVEGLAWEIRLTALSPPIADVDVEIRREDGESFGAGDEPLRCEGDGCLGAFALEVRKSATKSNDIGRTVVDIGVQASYVSDPPRYPEVGLTGVTLGSDGPSVIADGEVRRISRDWVAIRAPLGLDPNRNIVVEIDPGARGAIHLVTSDGTETISPGPMSVTEWPLIMPSSCAVGPCGRTLMFEMATPDVASREPATHGRIIDYGPGEQPLSIEHRRETFPTVDGRVQLATTDLAPGKTFEQRVRITVPSKLLEGSDTLRPVGIGVTLEGRIGGSEPSPAVFTLHGVDGREISGPEGEYLRLPAIECLETEVCTTEIVATASLPESATETVGVSFDVRATGWFPHLVVRPESRSLLVEVLEP